MVAVLSTAVGKLLSRRSTVERLWKWSDRIAWGLIAVGLIGCLAGLSGALGSPSSSYLMALGTVLGFLGLLWVAWA